MTPLVDSPYTARISVGEKGYDIVEMLDKRDYDSVMCRLHVRGHDGLVTWSDNWGIVTDLVQAGQLRSINRGPATYGHVDVYFV